jgi:hypothetical protein
MTSKQIVYHVGSLSFDRRLSNEIEKAASAAYAAYKKGEALLVQRRITDNRYEYISVERRRG